jgi:hypothetical protein
MQGAIGNMLRNTLGITKVQHSHAPPRPKEKKIGLPGCMLPPSLVARIFLPMCVLYHFWPGLSTTNILGTWGTPLHRILNMLPPK